ncbi:DUF3515 domain-containing protein [Rothia sp. P6271]|uniref:DUF3515 domain-containing protein n=1 Tax=Rothia sp. P6271 TaxID=3402659 RepID=UPI003AC9E714
MSILKKTSVRITSALCLATMPLSGCGAGAVYLTPAEDAANPRCAYAMVAMPQELSGFSQRETTAQATTAWGDPSVVVLKCGVSVQEPVSDPCVSVNGVDWILKPSKEQEQAQQSVQQPTGMWDATTFGRSPAIRITFDADKISSSTLLVHLSSAVKQLPQTKVCTNLSDELRLDS